MKPAPSRLYRPRPCEVETDAAGAPVRVDGTAVEAIREEWLVQDGWWTDKPLGRRYFELVLADGRDQAVFCEKGLPERWFSQRA